MWVKKCIEMREMLFKITNQTPPNLFLDPFKSNMFLMSLSFPKSNSFFFLLRKKHMYTKEREWGSNTKTHYKLHSKFKVTFKGERCKLYYTQQNLLSNVGQLPIFFWKACTHIREREWGSKHQGFKNRTRPTGSTENWTLI